MTEALDEGRSYGGESPADRAARRRRQLLDAGRRLFGTDGYRRVTVRQLCAQAKVAHRNFYDEFASTEELLLAVYEECVDELEGVVLAAYRAEAGAKESIRAGLDAFFATAESDHCLARIVWFEVLGVSDRVEETYLRRTEHFVALLESLAGQLGLATDAPATARTVLVRALVGGVSQVALTWVKDDFGTPRAELVDPLVLLMTVGAAAFDRG